MLTLSTLTAPVPPSDAIDCAGCDERSTADLCESCRRRYEAIKATPHLDREVDDHEWAIALDDVLAGRGAQ